MMPFAHQPGDQCVTLWRFAATGRHHDLGPFAFAGDDLGDRLVCEFNRFSIDQWQIAIDDLLITQSATYAALQVEACGLIIFI